MRDNGETRALLELNRWFGGLPAALQSMIIERSSVRTYRKGTPIQREGDAGKGLFALLDGRVRVVRSVAHGDEVLIYVGEPGFWFGDYCLLSGGALNVTNVVASSAVRTLLLPSKEFERIVEREPRYFREFAKLMLSRYAYFYRYVAEAPGLRSDEWLRTRLSDLAEGRRFEMSIAGPVTLNLSREDLAAMIGVSRETLRALLAKLEARGCIEVGFRSIRVLE